VQAESKNFGLLVSLSLKLRHRLADFFVLLIAPCIEKIIYS
jgi:hypothetical protein